MKQTLKLKKPVLLPVVKASRKPVAQSEAAAKRLANRLLNEEKYAIRLNQILKIQPVLDAHFAKPVFQDTVFFDDVECFRPLFIGIRETTFAWLRTQPEASDCSNTLLINLISSVLEPHALDPQYLAGLVKFNQRFDLDGNPIGEVLLEHKTHAQKMIQAHELDQPADQDSPPAG